MWTPPTWKRPLPWPTPTLPDAWSTGISPTSSGTKRASFPNDSGGSPGFALGFGLEFPIKIRENYLGLEALWHTVNFHDKYTQDYYPIPDGNGFGYKDLTGDVYTLMASYVINW